MGMNVLQQGGIVLALLLTLGGLLLLRSSEEKGKQRLLWLLLLAGGLMLLALFIAYALTPAQDNRPFWPVSTVLVPVATGVLALLALQWRQLASMNKGTQGLALLLALGYAAIMVLDWRGGFGPLYYLLIIVLVVVVGWSAGRRYPAGALYGALLLLLLLFGLNLMMNVSPAQAEPPPWLIWFTRALAPLLLASPGLAVVMAAVLLGNAFEEGAGRRAVLSPLLALALIAYLVYSIYWASVWDQTSDGLGGLVLTQPAALVAVGAGMVLAIAVSGWRRALGVAFTIGVPLLLYQAFAMGWEVSYHEITQERAERIAAALSAYEARAGRYPETLAALTPRYLLRLPQPVELRGETWCYQGGDDFYRLGTFYREFFSMPVRLQVNAAVGEPDGEWACAGQLAEMKERYYSPMEDPEAQAPPPPTPLPASELAQAAEVLAPLPLAGEPLWGSWSADGTYFLLGEREPGNTISLLFLEGNSGALCTAPGTYYFPPSTATLGERHAWLPDGRVLIVDDTEVVVLLAPCREAVETVTPAAAAGLKEVTAAAAGSVLLQGQDSYWIFDAGNLAWQQLPITPNPYDAHWDQAQWQPDGERLAISRLNGRDAAEGSTLYIVDGESGAVVRTEQLAAATDQSAARVDWLAPQQLLLMSSGVLRVLDLSNTPLRQVEVISELFGLALAFPDDVSGHDWWVEWESGRYILTLQAEDGDGESHYVYHSDSGTVEQVDVGSGLLLRFPDGEVEAWTRSDAEAAGEDTFVLVDVATGDTYPPLTLAGHTPRNYPRLNMATVAETTQLVVGSSQGISLHTLPEGERSGFWTLPGPGFGPLLRPAPDGSALVVIREQGDIYWLPLR